MRSYALVTHLSTGETTYFRCSKTLNKACNYKHVLLPGPAPASLPTPALQPLSQQQPPADTLTPGEGFQTLKPPPPQPPPAQGPTAAPSPNKGVVRSPYDATGLSPIIMANARAG